VTKSRESLGGALQTTSLTLWTKPRA